MSNGGLLEKASDQPAPSAVVADVVETPSGNVGVMAGARDVILFGMVPLALFRWFEVYLDFIPFLMPSVIIVTFGLVCWRLGAVSISFNGPKVNAAIAGVVVGIYSVMLLVPLVMGMILEGNLSVGEVEFSDDGEEITVKLRQNTISSKDVEASVSVLQSGQEVWSSSVTVSIDKSDGRGDYGSFVIQVSEFYSSNALPNSPYTLSVTVDGSEMSRDLDSNTLSRTITGVEGSTSGVVKRDSDRCSGDAENCLVGVVLTGWAGLEVGTDKPSGMPFADFTAEAVLMEGNDVAISYPTVTVVNSDATWDSNNGVFGTGFGKWGDFGSNFGLDGSVDDASYGKYITKEEFESAGDYGCYSFTITVTQEGSEPMSHTSFYDYSTSNSNDIWASVSSC